MFHKFFSALFLTLASIGSEVSAKDYYDTTPARSGLFEPDISRSNGGSAPALVEIGPANCLFLSPFGATRVEWTGGCNAGFASDAGHITMFGSDGFITERIFVGPGTEFRLTDGKLAWSEESGIGYTFVQPQRHDGGLMAGVFAHVPADFNAQFEDSLNMVAQEGFAMFQKHRDRVPGLSGEEVKTIVVILMRQGVQGGSGTAQIFLNGDGAIQEVSSPFITQFDQKLDHENSDIRQSAAQDKQASVREEAKARLEAVKKQHQDAVQAALGSTRSDLSLADMLFYERTRAIAVLSSGLEVTVPFDKPGFADGKFVLNWKEVARDIEREVSVEFQDQIVENWDELFKLTQKDPFAYLFEFGCTLPAEAAAGLVDGGRYLMKVKLLSIQDNRAALSCELSTAE